MARVVLALLLAAAAAAAGPQSRTPTPTITVPLEMYYTNDTVGVVEMRVPTFFMRVINQTLRVFLTLSSTSLTALNQTACDEMAATGCLTTQLEPMLPGDYQCTDLTSVGAVVSKVAFQGMDLRLARISLVVQEPPPYWHGVPARLGIAQPDYSTGSNFLSTYFTPAELNDMWSLDLDATGARASYLYLGGVPKSAVSNLLWGEKNPLPGCTDYNDQYFFAYHLSLCGVELAANYSSSIMTFMSLDEPCIIMSPLLFEATMSWLPVTCGEPSPVRCNLTTTAMERLDELPPLVFQMSEQGPRMAIPLRSLIINGTSSLCIKRPLDQSVPNRALPLLSRSMMLGLMAIQNFVVVSDWATNRTGLSPRLREFGDSRALCSASALPSCIGAQTYFAPTNECQDPPCENYVLQSVDPMTKLCVLSSDFYISFAAIIVSFSIWEFVQHHHRQKAIRRAMAVTEEHARQSIVPEATHSPSSTATAARSTASPGDE